ncbi:MAG: hypothetical protein JWL96_3238 [Sphingomonas bacterium]|nr:hypothetical protein [Sphingomonas bacterium]
MTGFVRRHRVMLGWLVTLAVATMVISWIAFWTAPAGEQLFYVVVALALGGGAVATGVELVAQVRAYLAHGQPLAGRAFVTLMLGMFSLPMTAGLVFLTAQLFDLVNAYRDLGSYRRIVAEARQGTLPADTVFQQRYGVSYYRETGPGLRLVFSIHGVDDYQEAVIYDSTGRVATPSHWAGNGWLEPDHDHQFSGGTATDCRAMGNGFYHCKLSWG